MLSSLRKLSLIALSTTSVMAATLAQAQTSGDSGWWPTSTQSYIGLNAGRSHFDQGRDDAYSLYVGIHGPSQFGLEAGGTDFGRTHDTEAYGFYLAGVGRIPLNETFTLFGKLGLMYSRSDSAGARDTGFGETYGVGMDIHINRQLAAVVQYDRSAVHLSTGRDRINMASLGLKFRY